MTAILWCRACRRPAEPGELLRVTPVDGSEPFTVHRVHLSPACLRAAGRADQCEIAEYDRDAAAAFDRASGAVREDHDRGAARAAERAIAANDAVARTYGGRL